MERTKILEWLTIANRIYEDNKNLFYCPEDKTHVISFEVIPYPEYGKQEITMKCLKCGATHTATIDIQSQQ